MFPPVTPEVTATLLGLCLIICFICCWRIIVQWRAHVRSTTALLFPIYPICSGRRACCWVCSPWPVHAQRDQGLFPLEGDDAGRIHQGER